MTTPVARKTEDASKERAKLPGALGYFDVECCGVRRDWSLKLRLEVVEAPPGSGAKAVQAQARLWNVLFRQKCLPFPGISERQFLIRGISVHGFCLPEDLDSDGMSCHGGGIWIRLVRNRKTGWRGALRRHHWRIDSQTIHTLTSRCNQQDTPEQ